MAEWISTHNGVTMICFLTMVFLLFICTLSPPTNRLSFFNTTVTRVISETEIQTIKVSFGVFGYTGSKPSVGYYMPSYFLFLYPIAAIFFGLASIAGLFPKSRTGGSMFCVFITLGSLCSLAAWIISSILFIYIGDSLASSGIGSQVGIASWLAIVVLSASPASIMLCQMHEFPSRATLPASAEPQVSVPENDLVVDIHHHDASEVQLGVYSGGLASAARSDPIIIPGRDSLYYNEYVAELVEEISPR